MATAHEVINDREIIAACIWMFSVFVFSGIYYFLWTNIPDSFILNSEFNVTPYGILVAHAYPNPDKHGTERPPLFEKFVDLEEFSETVKNIDRDIRSARTECDQLDRRLSAVREELTDAVAAHHTLRAKNLECFKTEQLAALQDALQLATRRLESLQADAGGTDRARAELAVSEATLRLSEREAEWALEIAGDISKFNDPAAFEAADSKSNELDDILDLNIQAHKRLRDMRVLAQETLEGWFASRKVRLKWIDFLYFSAGVSTTVTFGDIVPNSRSIRMLVLFQIILSVLTVGYFVSQISSA